jgi:hypothetical protein
MKPRERSPRNDELASCWRNTVQPLQHRRPVSRPGPRGHPAPRWSGHHATSWREPVLRHRPLPERSPVVPLSGPRTQPYPASAPKTVCSSLDLGRHRIHGAMRRQVAVTFAEERPSLLPLPLEPFRYYQYGERTVHLESAPAIDCGIAVLRLEMALQLARKYARECAPGSGVFPGQFGGASAGGFEQQSSAFTRPCALARPLSTQQRKHHRVSRSRPHNHEMRA